jgi:phosphopantothenoylcysteine decarboxylase/phosphopantothenate--cysteine ligase
MLANKKILLGVTGAIPAYKSVELVRLLRDQGALVRVVMTAAAQKFVTPLTFQAISGQPVNAELFSPVGNNAMPHIECARWPDIILIAPASADAIARIVHGHANDLLTTICLATQAPILLAPSMNQQMWHNQITQDNLNRARNYGMQICGPATGAQACGEFGLGRMLEPDELINLLKAFFQPKILNQLKILITAGPTQEAIDPVRYISNLSSGKMGYALAEAAQALGAEVTVVSGPTSLNLSPSIKRINVVTAAEMQTAVMKHISSCDIFISAAAIADYRLEKPAAKKIKKSADLLTLTLVPNIDILSMVAALPEKPFTVGFALETENLLANAQAKLQRKNLDMIVANLVSKNSGFGADQNAVTVIARNGETKQYPLMTKTALAYELLQQMVDTRAVHDKISLSPHIRH